LGYLLRLIAFFFFFWLLWKGTVSFPLLGQGFPLVPKKPLVFANVGEKLLLFSLFFPVVSCKGPPSFPGRRGLVFFTRPSFCTNLFVLSFYKRLFSLANPTNITETPCGMVPPSHHIGVFFHPQVSFSAPSAFMFSGKHLFFFPPKDFSLWLGALTA